MGSGTHVMPTQPCSAFPFRAALVQEVIEGCMVSLGVLRVVIGGRPTESLLPHVLGHPGSWDSWLLDQSAPDRAHPRNLPHTEEPHSRCLVSFLLKQLSVWCGVLHPLRTQVPARQPQEGKTLGLQPANPASPTKLAVAPEADLLAFSGLDPLHVCLPWGSELPEPRKGAPTLGRGASVKMLSPDQGPVCWLGSRSVCLARMVLQVRVEVPPEPCPEVGDGWTQHLTFRVLGEPVIQELWRPLKKESDTSEPGRSITAAPYKGLAEMMRGLLFHPESRVYRGDTAPPPPPDSVSLT